MVRFRVSAVNAVGTGDPSGTASATPFGLPGAPTGLSATAGAWKVDLAWTAPTDDGGSAVTGYRIERSADGTTWTDSVADTGSTATAHTVVGLTGGSVVRFRVSARTTVGDGPAGVSATATPYRTPDAPTGLTAVAGVGRLTLSWTAPSTSGGSSVTHYEVRYTDPGGAVTTLHSTTGPGTTATVTGLTPDVELRLSVVAVNAAGAGPPSATVAAVPSGVPPTTVPPSTTAPTTTVPPMTTTPAPPTTTMTTVAPTTPPTPPPTPPPTTPPPTPPSTVPPSTMAPTTTVPPTSTRPPVATAGPLVPEPRGQVPPRPVYIG